MRSKIVLLLAKVLLVLGVFLILVSVSFFSWGVYRRVTYDSETNDCEAITERWEKRLNRVGFETDVAVGWNETSKEGHVWLIVEGVHIDFTACGFGPFFSDWEEIIVYDDSDDMRRDNPIHFIK